VNKVLRASVVVAAAGLAVPLWAVPSAFAASASEQASIGAYFYRQGITTEGMGLPVEPPSKPPNVTGEAADGVAKGNLAVSAQGGQEDKVSFLQFGLAEAPLEGTIDSALLNVPLVPSSPPSNISFNEKPELVRVCMAGDSGFFGQDGESILLAPERLCDKYSSEPGKLSKDGKSYVFDITGLAATWLEANDGLALTVAEGAESSPFQVVFAPADKATLAYSFTASEEVLETPALPDTGTSFDSGTAPLDSGFTGGELPSVDSGFGSVESPIVDTALPEPQTMGAPAPPPDVAGTPVRNVAAMKEAPLTPSASFWAGLLALAGIVGLLSLIMGDPRVAAAGTATSQSRLSKALQGRQGAAATRGPRLARPLAL
jgi:hypothetical protein